MPELPEVEIARRHLSRWLAGAEVARAHAHDARGVVAGSPAAFARALAGRVVVRVDRKGKWLRIELTGGLRLFSHLGMTGRWVRRRVGDAEVPWERVCLDLSRRGKASSVRYVDARRFGRLVVSREDIPAWRALGPDPLADGIDVDRLASLLARRRRSVKEALMDQGLLAGVGNIQATEALWKARIDPRSRSDALSLSQVRAIARGIDWTIARTLADAEEHGDELGYVSDADGDNPFRIYGRRGEPCPCCKTLLVRIVLGGRGTALCPKCQARVGGKGSSRASRRGPPSRRGAGAR